MASTSFLPRLSYLASAKRPCAAAHASLPMRCCPCVAAFAPYRAAYASLLDVSRCRLHSMATALSAVAVSKIGPHPLHVQVQVLDRPRLDDGEHGQGMRALTVL